MNPATKNPLRTRKDMARAAVQLLEPLLPYLSRGRARLRLGDTGAVYSDAIAQMEAFARPLWAIVPMLAGRCPEAEPLWALWREGLAHGVDPAHPEYWGEINASDQRMVEMAVMGVGLCLCPDRFLGDLSAQARQNLVRWLSQINDFEMPANNWVFFRILVNTGFQLNGFPHSQARLAQDFALVESRYDADGWYHDYPTQRDYYTPWAFHYYGLLYAKAMRKADPERAQRFVNRARLYAPQFAAWFAGDGEAIPYGRSLTYRFAQGSFFASLAVAEPGKDAVPWGEYKALLLANLRNWLKKPIFTADGLLTIGYGYPNLIMSEGYNAPGSPYWAMKAFMALALPESHPFWQAEEALPDAPGTLAQPYAGLLIARDSGNRHVQAFAAGNHAPAHEHGEAKYEKFAYSTAFGFSVSRGDRSLGEGAFDSMLALSDDGVYWRARFGCEDFAILPDKVVSTWKPYPDVTVHTEIIPRGDWHLRVHTIQTHRALTAAEGGYAILRETEQGKPLLIQDALKACVHADWGTSGIVALQGYKSAEVLTPQPNTNLMHPRTLLPTLHAAIEPGETTLVCAVLGAVDGGTQKWADGPGREGLSHAKLG